jgi:signal transduction protein with GAF and PtsI domain
VAATDQTILDMDANQYATGEGPCVDASVEGRWFHVESLEQETRWPDFIPKARALGINAILSSPLLAAERPVGALNIYSRTQSAFSEKEQELAAIFATEASIILRDAGADVPDDQLSELMQAALESRQIVARAEGVIMEREGISAEDAFTALRNFSRSTNRPLVERAADVVDSTRRAASDPSMQSEEAPRPSN